MTDKEIEIEFKGYLRGYKNAQNWQPIDTAPIGEMVLLFDNNCDLILFGVGSYDNHGWNMATQYGEQQHPTHWMQLPKPPES